MRHPLVLVAALVTLVTSACGSSVGGDAPPSTVTTLRSITYYADCDAARDANAVPMRRGDPGYRPPLDRDGDGVACANEED